MIPRDPYIWEILVLRQTLTPLQEDNTTSCTPCAHRDGNALWYDLTLLPSERSTDSPEELLCRMDKHCRVVDYCDYSSLLCW
jgi:hypothetical protein